MCFRWDTSAYHALHTWIKVNNRCSVAQAIVGTRILTDLHLLKNNAVLRRIWVADSRSFAGLREQYARLMTLPENAFAL